MNKLDAAVKKLGRSVKEKRKGKQTITIYCDYTDLTRGYSEQETKRIWQELKLTCPHIANEIKVWKEVFGDIRLTRFRRK